MQQYTNLFCYENQHYDANKGGCLVEQWYGNVIDLGNVETTVALYASMQTILMIKFLRN